MIKKETIRRYGKAAYAKMQAQTTTWKEAHPEEAAASNKVHGRERSRKGGKLYERHLKYNQTGLQGDKNRIRYMHNKKWRHYKKIIAPDSQIHHEWVPETANYKGVALVEKAQHQYGIIDVIKILEGEITLLTEEEIREQEFSVAFFTKKKSNILYKLSLIMTKCDIVGCINSSVYITRPGMSAGCYCRRHFFEIYAEPREVFDI